MEFEGENKEGKEDSVNRWSMHPLANMVARAVMRSTEGPERGGGGRQRSEPPAGWARWPETRDLGARPGAAAREWTTCREDSAGGQTVRRDKGAGVVRHPGEDPGQEAADQRPAGCLEVQPGRQLPERAGDASEMRTVSGAEVPRSEWGYAQRTGREAQSEGREEEQPTRLGTPVEATRRMEARTRQEGVRQERSGGLGDAD